jgi:hypothetical protein
MALIETHSGSFSRIVGKYYNHILTTPQYVLDYEKQIRELKRKIFEYRVIRRFGESYADYLLNVEDVFVSWIGMGNPLNKPEYTYSEWVKLKKDNNIGWGKIQKNHLTND